MVKTVLWEDFLLDVIQNKSVGTKNKTSTTTTIICNFWCIVSVVRVLICVLYLVLALNFIIVINHISNWL